MFTECLIVTWYGVDYNYWSLIREHGQPRAEVGNLRVAQKCRSSQVRRYASHLMRKVNLSFMSVEETEKSKITIRMRNAIHK